MQKLEKEFNQFLANLAVWTMKLHNIHWNVEGMEFIAIHEFTDSLYNTTFEQMDEVAEHFKKSGLTPVSTMKEYLELATIKEVPTGKFTCSEALDIVLKDLEAMRKEASDLRNAADEEGWFSAVGMLEGFVDIYNKDIWFLRAMRG